MPSSNRVFARLAIVLAASVMFTGCTVISVASTAVGVAATGAGLAVDAAVGTAKVVGGAVSAVVPGKSDD